MHYLYTSSRWIDFHQLLLVSFSCRPHTYTQFYGPFSGTTRVSQYQKKSSSALYGARGRHTGHPADHHSILTNQRPSHFYAGCLSCCNPPTLSWLETGTKYTGLHTQWRGFFM